MKRLIVFVLGAFLAVNAVAQAPVDWANFGRFESENATRKGDPEVVLMGNSITECWIAKRPGFFAKQGYVSRAISGQTSSQMLVRFRADVLKLGPQIVVINAGTNDLAQNTGYISIEHIMDNIESMVELARANGVYPILISVLPADDFSWRPGLEPAPKIVRLNELIRAYAEREKLPYVDYYTSMATSEGALNPLYTQDGVHPTEAGYLVMEQILPPVVDRVREQLAASPR